MRSRVPGKWAVLTAAAFILWPALSQAAQDQTVGLCKTGETVIFSCPAGKKTISVCGATTGAFEYRFGKSGAEPELVVSSSTDAAFHGAAEMFSGGGGSWLRFHRGPYAYAVFTGIGKWGPGGAVMDTAGVVVEQAAKKKARVKCTDSPTGIIGPDWMEAAGITSGDQDFPLFSD